MKENLEHKLLSNFLTEFQKIKNFNGLKNSIFNFFKNNTDVDYLGVSIFYDWIQEINIYSMISPNNKDIESIKKKILKHCQTFDNFKKKEVVLSINKSEKEKRDKENSDKLYTKHLKITLNDKAYGIITLISKNNHNVISKEEEYILSMIKYVLAKEIFVSIFYNINKKKSYEIDKKVNAYSQISNIIKNVDTLEKLLKNIAYLTQSILKVNRASVILKEEHDKAIVINLSKRKKKSVLKKAFINLKDNSISSYVIKTGKTLFIKDIRKIKKLDFKFVYNYDSFSMISVPIKIRNRVVGAINVTDKIDNEMFTQDDKQLLEILSVQISNIIETSNLNKKIQTQEMFERELEIAKQIQIGFLPKHSLENEEVRVYGRSFPAERMCGDFFDYYKLSNDKVLISIADVAGKGMRAALSTVFFKSYLKSYANENYSAKKICEKINNIIMNDLDPEIFVTAFIGILDLKTNTLRYVNAGHNHPIVLNKKSSSHKYLKNSGIFLGMYDDIEYVEHKVKLKKDHRLILYTDGLTDAMNEKSVHFGIRNSLKMFKIFKDSEPYKFVSNIKSQVDNFIGKKKQLDDITLVTVDFIS